MKFPPPPPPLQGPVGTQFPRSHWSSSHLPTNEAITTYASPSALTSSVYTTGSIISSIMSAPVTPVPRTKSASADTLHTSIQQGRQLAALQQTQKQSLPPIEQLSPRIARQSVAGLATGLLAGNWALPGAKPMPLDTAAVMGQIRPQIAPPVLTPEVPITTRPERRSLDREESHTATAYVAPYPKKSRVETTPRSEQETSTRPTQAASPRRLSTSSQDSRDLDRQAAETLSQISRFERGSISEQSTIEQVYRSAVEQLARATTAVGRAVAERSSDQGRAAVGSVKIEVSSDDDSNSGVATPRSASGGEQMLVSPAAEAPTTIGTSYPVQMYPVAATSAEPPADDSQAAEEARDRYASEMKTKKMRRQILEAMKNADPKKYSRQIQMMIPFPDKFPVAGLDYGLKAQHMIRTGEITRPGKIQLIDAIFHELIKYTGLYPTPTQKMAVANAIVETFPTLAAKMKESHISPADSWYVILCDKFRNERRGLNCLDQSPTKMGKLARLIHSESNAAAGQITGQVLEEGPMDVAAEETVGEESIEEEIVTPEIETPNPDNVSCNYETKDSLRNVLMHRLSWKDSEPQNLTTEEKNLTADERAAENLMKAEHMGEYATTASTPPVTTQEEYTTYPQSQSQFPQFVSVSSKDGQFVSARTEDDQYVSTSTEEIQYASASAADTQDTRAGTEDEVIILEGDITVIKKRDSDSEEWQVQEQHPGPSKLKTETTKKLMSKKSKRKRKSPKPRPTETEEEKQAKFVEKMQYCYPGVKVLDEMTIQCVCGSKVRLGRARMLHNYTNCKQPGLKPPTFQRDHLKRCPCPPENVLPEYIPQLPEGSNSVYVIEMEDDSELN